MNQPDEHRSTEIAVAPTDSDFQQEVERLYQLTLYSRWCMVAGLWLTVGTLSVWGLRYPISLLLDYFTWSAVRYGLAFNRLPAIGLATCIGFTVAVLLWQSRNVLFGLSEHDRQQLEQQVQRIRLQGRSHPLWKSVCQRK
ncbi:MAG: hypothetical protein KME42_07615 [Tildeniella nuda ZEHNDER 1965/U140]|jgi:hypothetical protein|nr:hypothetical protein [Tildeniella nuda ZEHNDER 1965/U140]